MMKILFISRMIANVLALLFLLIFAFTGNTVLSVFGYIFLALTVILAVIHLILRRKRKKADAKSAS